MSPSTTTPPTTKLSFFDITIIVVSLVIGMGIFGTPSKVAATSGSSTIFFAVWIAGGVVALCGALTYAEIGLRLPVMGGYYKVFAACYHPAVGFTINVLIIISNAASLAVVALIGTDYVSDLLFGKPSGVLFNTSLSIVAVFIFYCVNFLGLKTSSKTQNVLMTIKIAAIIILAASVLKGVIVEPHGYEESPYAFLMAVTSKPSILEAKLNPPGTLQRESWQALYWLWCYTLP